MPETIENLSLEFSPGHIYGLFGSNGVGKTTLLYLIAGLLTPTSGNVLLNGVSTRRRLPSTLASMFIVPEELTLPEISLREYVAVNSAFYPNFSHDDLERHLSTFDISSLMERSLASLSMGQRKKVYMSFALACNTPVVLMDEPTNGLDIPGKAAFRRFVASAADENRIIVISTHQAHDIETLVDHIIMLEGRGLLLSASTDEIARRLAFMITTDPNVIARALFASPTVGGTAVVVANDGSNETEVNLESLFEAAVTHPIEIKRLFGREDNSIDSPLKNEQL